MLNPDSAIPRQLSVCGGLNKVQPAEASKAAPPVDLSEFLLLSRRMPKPAGHWGMPRGLAFIRAWSPRKRRHRYVRHLNGGGWWKRYAGHDPRAKPAKVSPELSPVGNSLTVSRAGQNI